jgi:hypothetical protein
LNPDSTKEKQMSDQRSTSGGNATDVARREGVHLEDSARDAAATVGDTASEHGQRLTRDAREHARGIARDAQRQLRSHAQDEIQRAGSALGTAGDQLRALADGRVDDAGVLGDYVDQAADVVNRWARTVSDRGLDGLLDDLRTFGRRRPGVFLAGALVAGIAAGRFGRNAAPELGDDTGSQRSDEPRHAAPRDDGGQNTPATASGGDRVRARAWEPVGGLVDAGGDGADEATDVTARPSGEARSTTGRGASDDDVIVGYATDDRAVVSGAEGEPSHGRTPADDGLEYRPIDVDQDRSR